MCVGEKTNACFHMTWQTGGHPPSGNAIRRTVNAYGTCCRYDHRRPSTAAGGAVGTVLHDVPFLCFYSPHLPSDLTASIVTTNLHKPGKCEKRTLVLKD